MPYINATVPKAWKLRGEPDRIHFTFVTQNGQVQRLYTDRGSELFLTLETELLEAEDIAPQTA